MISNETQCAHSVCCLSHHFIIPFFTISCPKHNTFLAHLVNRPQFPDITLPVGPKPINRFRPNDGQSALHRHVQPLLDWGAEGDSIQSWFLDIAETGGRLALLSKSEFALIWSALLKTYFYSTTFFVLISSVLVVFFQVVFSRKQCCQ